MISNCFFLSRLITLFSALTLLSCSITPTPLPALPQGRRCASLPDTYTVKRGDTLLRIAWAHCVNYRDLAKLNKLANPDLILIGQRLRLPVVSEPANRMTNNAHPGDTKRSTVVTAVAERIDKQDWHWPTDGKVISSFRPDNPGQNGIRISGNAGQPVRVTTSGQIVYTGDSLPGYGTLIIVEHEHGLLSAYGYLGKMLVKEGDTVTPGQTIAELGIGNNNQPALHFEIRKDGQPVDPFQFLPG